LTLIPLIKYVFIVLRAGDRGNGKWASWSSAISKALVTTASKAVLDSQLKCPLLLPEGPSNESKGINK
jgi:K+ transporter